MIKQFIAVCLMSSFIIMSCCKPQKDEMQCDTYCLDVRGTLICVPDNTPLKNIEVRLSARKSTGIGASNCRLIETKTNNNGEFVFSADLENFLALADNYSFDLTFKHRKYKNSDASEFESETKLFRLYDIDSVSVGQPMDTTFYLERK